MAQTTIAFLAAFSTFSESWDTFPVWRSKARKTPFEHLRSRRRRFLPAKSFIDLSGRPKTCVNAWNRRHPSPPPSFARLIDFWVPTFVYRQFIIMNRQRLRYSNTVSGSPRFQAPCVESSWGDHSRSLLRFYLNSRFWLGALDVFDRSDRASAREEQKERETAKEASTCECNVSRMLQQHNQSETSCGSIKHPKLNLTFRAKQIINVLSLVRASCCGGSFFVVEAFSFFQVSFFNVVN